MDKDIREGRIWILQDRGGKLIEDIDTDQIYHNAHLHITDVAQMGQFALGNLEGWRDFPGKSREGDILVAGRNFGAGSSRQQAVDCFIALKVGAVLSPSFSAIYFRNAVNSGFPVLKIRDLESLVAGKSLMTGDVIQCNVRTGEAKNLTRNISFTIEPMSPVQHEIFMAGDVFKYGEKLAKCIR
jgi:3-isopropylmalate/(R)-2-methylmalate dehydratase small subunit